MGSETLIDRSKSIKSTLMTLFPADADIGGVDNLNACYGGTAALLNSIDWIEGGEWDGRLAIVVAGDIALYDEGPARATGGAAAVALLIGPDAPIAIERPGTAAHHMVHAYDFYKPDPSSEYPTVDGQSSIDTYLSALQKSYALHLDKVNARIFAPSLSDGCQGAGSGHASLDDFSFVIFHSPYGKLVQKAFGRMLLVDHLRDPARAASSALAGDLERLSSPSLFSSQPDTSPTLSPTFSIASSCGGSLINDQAEVILLGRELDTLMAKHGAALFAQKTEPSRLIPRLVGNSYCASLFSGLISLLASPSASVRVGDRIGMFSYGSGAVATFFSLHILSSPANVVDATTLLADLHSRQKVPPADFKRALGEREALYGRCDWAPSQKAIDSLRPGTFHLVAVDGRFRRSYAQKKAQPAGEHAQDEAHPLC